MTFQDNNFAKILWQSEFHLTQQEFCEVSISQTNTAMKRLKAVSAYFTSMHILPSGFRADQMNGHLLPVLGGVYGIQIHMVRYIVQCDMLFMSRCQL